DARGRGPVQGQSAQAATTSARTIETTTSPERPTPARRDLPASAPAPRAPSPPCGRDTPDVRPVAAERRRCCSGRDVASLGREALPMLATTAQLWDRPAATTA